MYDELVKRVRQVAEEVCEDYDVDPYDAEQRCLAILQAANAMVEMSERIEAYETAESEGRLIILPVKEGTPLFVDGKIFAPHCKGEVHEVKDWYYSFPMIYKDFRGEHDYVIDPDSIGNSVFLTRDEAEKELNRKTILSEPPKEGGT